MRTPLYLDFEAGTIAPFSEAEMAEAGLPVVDAVATTNATPATLATITPPVDARGFLLVYMAANTEGGDEGLVGAKFVHWKTVGGAATVVNVAALVADNLEGLTTASWTVDASGGGLRIRVTGELATNINWSANWNLKTILTTTPP